MYLGLDIGTSSLKAVIADAERVQVSSAAAITTASPRPGWSEQDPALWWQATRTALAELARVADLSAITCIGLSGQMHGAVLLDRDHRVLRPAILWNDSRAIEDCAAMRDADPEIGHTAGVLPLPGFTAPKLRWLSRKEPELHGRIARVLLPKDYVGFLLHGEMATDVSDAAGTLWLDQESRAWSPHLARISATDPDWLPTLFHGHEVVGQLRPDAAAETGLVAGIPVVAGGGDAATGAVSLGATEPGHGFISLGTSGQLFVADRVYKPNPERFVHAFAHAVPGRWYQMAAMLNGARPISWFADQIGLGAADVVAEAAQNGGERAPIFLPYLTGERSPHGNPHARAAFLGLEDATDRAAMCRAVVEAVAFTFADAIDSFGTDLGGLDSLAAIGGGSRSDLVLQLIANVTGKPIGRSAGADTGPAFGAARLAACAAGALSLDDLATRPVVETWFEPASDPRLDARLARYRALYDALAEIRWS